VRFHSGDTSLGVVLRFAILLFGVQASLGPLEGVHLVSGLEDGRIGVLYVGDLVRSPPFNMMKSDPLFVMQYVPASLRGDWAAQAGLTLDDVHRMIRLYIPRTYGDLKSRFDVIVLANANPAALGAHKIEMLAQGVREGGIGLLMSGGWESFGGTGTWSPPWGPTAIGRLLPTEDIIGIWTQDGRLVIKKPNNELIKSLPWDPRNPVLSQVIRWHHNPVTLKIGGELLAEALCTGGQRDPLMVTWQLENAARVFALTSEIHTLSWYGQAWEYDYDFGSNLMIYLNRRPVPQDVSLVHLARSKILETQKRRSLLISLLDFCESFGASTRRILGDVDEVDAVISEANAQYLQLDYNRMMETYRRADSMLEKVENDAVKLKNRALLWVHIIEWLSVTGTFLACGFVLWSVMVRRRLYREVSVTRFR